MNSMDLKKILKVFGAILRCPICSFGYNLDTMRVVENSIDEGSGEAKILIYSDCKKCKGSVVFNIGMTEGEMFSAASVTDLTFDDARKFENIPVLSPDDCMEIHRQVQNIDENFFSKLAKKD